MTKSGFIKTPKQMLADGDISEDDVAYKQVTIGGKTVDVVVLKSVMEAQNKPFTTKPKNEAGVVSKNLKKKTKPNESIIGDRRVAIQSAYPDKKVFVANVTLIGRNNTASSFRCEFGKSGSLLEVTKSSKNLIKDKQEIASMRQFLENNSSQIKDFAESL